MPSQMPPIVQADIEQSVPDKSGPAATNVPAASTTAACVNNTEKVPAAPLPSSPKSATSAGGSAGASAPEPGRRDSAAHLSLWNNRKVTLHAYAKDVWALGLTIVYGGQYFAWNIGLSSGFASFLLSTFLISTGYVVLCMCLAEMTSAMPFAGGSYGFARVTMGTYMGFMVGCCETLEYIAYVSAAVLGFGQMITIFTQLPVIWEPLYWALFYVTALGILIMGGKHFWRFNLACCLLITIIPYAYCFLVIPDLDIKRLAWPGVQGGTGLSIMAPYVRGGFHEFMKGLPLASWWYVGCEALPLASEEVHNAKANVPKGMVACVLTLFVSCFGLIFTVVCGSQGVEVASKVLLPLNDGFSRILVGNASLSNFMTVLTLPSAWATGMGFMFCYGRQMFAMARSGLFPKLLTKTRGTTGVPYMAFLMGSLLSLIILVVAWWIPAVGLTIFQICISSAYATYITQLMSYMTLLKHYPNIAREYKSPFGVYGAWWGIAVFSLALIASLGFQPNAWITPSVMSVYILCCSCYYWLVARHNQVISPEEEAVMFIAYVVKNNMMKARKKRRKSKAAFLTSSPSHRNSVGHPSDGPHAGVPHRNASFSAASLDDLRKSFMAASSTITSGHQTNNPASSIPPSGTPASPQAAAFSPRPPIHLPLHQRLLYHLLSLAFTKYRVVVITEDGGVLMGPTASGEADAGTNLNPGLNGTLRIVPDRRGVHEMFKNWLRKKPRVTPAALPTSP